MMGTDGAQHIPVMFLHTFCTGHLTVEYSTVTMQHVDERNSFQEGMQNFAIFP